MSPIMFLLGAVLGLAVGLAVIHIKAKPTPQANPAPPGLPYRIASGANENREFVYDQSYISHLLGRDVRRALDMHPEQDLYFEVAYVIGPADGGYRITATVKAKTS